MSIHEHIKNSERCNLILMEDIAYKKITAIDEAVKMCNENFISALKHAGYLHQNETNYFNVDKEIKAIILQLMQADINEVEAAAATNSIWIKRINKIREPGAPVINLSNFRNDNQFIQ